MEHSRAEISAFGFTAAGPGGGGPQFDVSVVPGGYAWWYVDAVSDDGRHALSIISFVGSVFSPYYKWARRKPPASPEDYVSINVALYGAGGHRWTMTERGRRELVRTADRFQVGPTSLNWDGQGLTFDIDEMTVPIPRRLKGRVRVLPSALNQTSFVIDANGEHLWRPIAPVARVEVDFEHGLRWAGNGYFDWNAGSVPLEDSFHSWDWSRASDREGATIFYDVQLKDGRKERLSFLIRPDAEIRPIETPSLCSLPSSPVWRVRRGTRSDGGQGGAVVKTLEDTPFYVRSLVASNVNGKPVTAMHESLWLNRFISPVVQMMLPFRMPRWANR